jgi:hypothetical protein
VEKIRDFQLNPSRGRKQKDEIMPPPFFTNQSLPLIWNWQPDPPEDIGLQQGSSRSNANTAPRRKNYNPTLNSIHPDADCPTEIPADVSYAKALQPMISLLQEAFNERPIWAREALASRVSHSPHMATLKKALQYVAYRFTAGPWRDCLIKRGVDPRRDPTYRVYQTIYFRVHNEEKAEKKWYQPSRYANSQNHARSAIQTFDGKSFTPGNRIWQVCDISDPLLERLIKTAPFRQSCDNACDGWFTNGALAKIRSIMRTKLDVIQLGKKVTDEEFAVTLEFPDVVAGKRDHRDILVPLPDVYPSNEQISKMSQNGIHLIRTGARKATLEKGPLRSRNRSALRHTITTFEDTDDDDPTKYPIIPRFTSGEDDDEGDLNQGPVIAATSFREAYIGQTRQDEVGRENEVLYGEKEQRVPGSFDGAEDAQSVSERSEIETDEDGDSDVDTANGAY